MTTISILNYGMGNIRSVCNALDYLRVKFCVIDSPEQVLESKKLILPGVGSFRLAMENLTKKNILEALNYAVLRKRIPILGICLGMQLMAQESEEDGLTRGLGWIKGSINKFSAEELSIKVPHVGFNTVFFGKQNSILFKGLGDYADYYFVHSYRLPCNGIDGASGWADYGERFIASIEKENIFATQFHPEKSQSNGLILLKNFADLKW